MLFTLGRQRLYTTQRPYDVDWMLQNVQDRNTTDGAASVHFGDKHEASEYGDPIRASNQPTTTRDGRVVVRMQKVRDAGLEPATPRFEV